MTPLVLNLPLKVSVGKTARAKKHLLNLNFYRNANFRVLNDMKVAFKELVKDQIKDLPVFTKAEFRYVLFPGSLHLQDISNVCSVIDKFFSDAFVESGKLPEDNYNHLTKITFEFGGVDKNNPRCEVHITGDIEEMEIMKISLNEDETEDALKNYIIANPHLIQEAINAYVEDYVALKDGQSVSTNIESVPHGGYRATLEVVTKKSILTTISATADLVGAAAPGTKASDDPVIPEPRKTTLPPITTVANTVTEKPAEPVNTPDATPDLGLVAPAVEPAPDLFQDAEPEVEAADEPVADTPVQEADDEEPFVLQPPKSATQPVKTPEEPKKSTGLFQF